MSPPDVPRAFVRAAVLFGVVYLSACHADLAYAAPIKDLFDALVKAPYFAPPPTSATRLALVRKSTSGYELIKIAPEGPVQAPPAIVHWLEHHRTFAGPAWFVAQDKSTGVPVFWAPVSDCVDVFDEIGGANQPFPGEDIGTVVPFDPAWDVHVYKYEPSTHQAAQQPLTQSTSAGTKFGRLNRVRTATAPGPVDIVFLSAGFEQSELDRYRSAVACIKNGLLADPAFAKFKDAINIWRMDLYVPDSATHPNYTGDAPGCAVSDPDSLLGDTNRPAIKQYDLTIDQQGTSPLVWFRSPQSGFLPVLEDVIAMLGHKPLVVATLMNEGESRGGGEVCGGVAIASLNDIADGHRLTSHEIGHALGLYDEKPPTLGVTGVTYPTLGPNVISSSQIESKNIPSDWAALCPQDGCQKYLRASRDCAISGLTPDKTKVGFWLGANMDCNFFAPTDFCRMNDPTGERFCDVCLQHMSSALSAGQPANNTVLLSLPGDASSASPTNLNKLFKPDGSRDSIARVRSGSVVGEVVVRCFNVTKSVGPGHDVTYRLNAVPEKFGPTCKLQGEPPPVGGLSALVVHAGSLIKVTKVIDDIGRLEWSPVDAMQFHRP